MKNFPSLPSLFLSFFIIGIAPWARKILRFIYSHIERENASQWLKISFMIGFILLTFYFINRLKKIDFKPLSFLFLFPFLPFAILFFKIKLPEEKIHLMEYSLLGLLLYKDYIKGKVKLSLSISFIIILSFLDELFQLILPDRIFDYRDIIFNFTGGLAGWSLGKLLIKGE